MPDVVAGLARPVAAGGDRPRLRMLLSSAGRRVALLRAFRSAAQGLGVDLEICAGDLRPAWSPACVEADHAVTMPPASSPDFVGAMLSFCRRRGIDLVVPTIDTELSPLGHARDRFDAIGTTVAVSSPVLVDMARDKLATAVFLAAADIPAPRTTTPEVLLAEGIDWPWPLLAKPRHGSSGFGVTLVHGRDEVRRLPAEPYVVQELLRGREFTVNLYFDAAGQLGSAVPHERIKVRSGEVEKGVTSRHPLLCDLGRRLALALPGPRGALCFQAFLADDGSASIFEINARFGGGYPLADRAGATFARWLLEERLGRASSIGDAWRDGVMMLRYDDAVFV